MPTKLTTKVSTVDREIFEKLTLPEFKPTDYDDNDPRLSTKPGQASAHRALTTAPGLKEWIQRDGHFPGPYPSPIELRGAIIHCYGTISAHNNNTRPFTSTVVSSFEATLHAQDPPCAIPSLIGLPIWMRTYKGDPNQPENDRANPLATYLHVIGPSPSDADSDDDFGFTAKTVLDSAVVVRMDEKQLLPQHLEALCFFCKHVYDQVFSPPPSDGEDSEGVPNHNARAPLSDAENGTARARLEVQKRHLFRRLARRGRFETFYQDFCRRRERVEGVRWKGLPSPYAGEELEGGGAQSVEDVNAEDGREGRRSSGRVVRRTEKALDGAEGSSSVEARGRTRKRPFEGEGEEGG